VKDKQLKDLTDLLGVVPENGTSHKASELKGFIQNSLEGKYPDVPRGKTLAVVVPYLLGVRSKMSELSKDSCSVCSVYYGEGTGGPGTS